VGPLELDGVRGFKLAAQVGVKPVVDRMGHSHPLECKEWGNDVKKTKGEDNQLTLSPASAPD